MVNRHCIVCGNGKFKKSNIKGLIKCCKCGFLTANLELSFDDLQKLYSRNYFCGEEYADYQKDKAIIQEDFVKRIHRMNDFAQKSERRVLFEIGCAYGFFLEVAAKFYGNVSGIDISQDAIDYANGELNLEVRCGDYLYTEITPCNVICMWDTVEHLSDPELYLKKVYKDLVRGGTVCITTGDVESVLAKIRGGKWRQIHPPTHLHYFSRKTLCAMLERLGFEIIDVSYPSKLISLNTVLYTILCLKSHHEKAYNFFRRMKITELNMKVNLYDFMFVIARKKIS